MLRVGMVPGGTGLPGASDVAGRVGRGCCCRRAFQEEQAPRLGAGRARGGAGEKGHRVGRQGRALRLRTFDLAGLARQLGPGGQARDCGPPSPTEMAGPSAEPLTHGTSSSPFSALRDDGHRNRCPRMTQKRGRPEHTQPRGDSWSMHPCAGRAAAWSRRGVTPHPVPRHLPGAAGLVA